MKKKEVKSMMVRKMNDIVEINKVEEDKEEESIGIVVGIKIKKVIG